MATPALAFTQLANEVEADGLTPKTAERIGAELAKTFGVQLHEVGILKIVGPNLVFMYPPRLHNVGSIPLNTSGSIAARTASAKRAEVINNFAQTRHTSIFEAVELESKQHAIGEKWEKSVQPIQKLMSVPVVGPGGVLGVIQLSRKGTSAPAAGPDFSAPDLQKLVAVAGALAKIFK
jgi:hypothetical protein